MSSSAHRWFHCALCRCLQVICSRCDRGQRYCTGDCRHQARRRSQQAAGRRYQLSRRGRFSHAARQRRYRARQKIVTHQGSQPLRVALSWRAAQSLIEPAAQPQGLFCHWCGRCTTWLRRRWLRYTRAGPVMAKET